MRILVTGGSGVLGRGLLPLFRADGHDVTAPGSKDLNLFDASGVENAMQGIDVVYHLATRIPPPELSAESGAWEENDRLRSHATRLLADAALKAGASVFVLPSITFLYPATGPADETTPVESVGRLQSMLDAETEVRRFTEADRRGVILRLGLLWGPGTGNDAPVDRYGDTLHIDDAAEALNHALDAPADIYNVVSDGQRIANSRFKSATGWQPRR